MPEARKIKICDTTFRDAHQSLLATRLATGDIMEIAGEMDKIGFHSMEVWGGATFDAMMRFLNEDPWERLKALRRAMPNTKLQMLLRGQNLVGYRHYADDVAEEFVKRVVANGMDIIRIFDALNDSRNLEKTMRAAKDEGAHVQAAISYTNSPYHNMQHFAELTKKLKEMGADSICIKDMAGIMYPYGSFELVSAIKAATGLPVQIHCHYTSGMAAMSYLKGVEAGADILDCAVASMALSTSQPAIETMVATFQGTDYDTGLDLDQLAFVSEKMKQIRKKYKAYDVADPTVDPNVLRYQMPGGMISNFISQLQESKAMDKLQEVLEEVPKVRKDLGYPPLVTPSSQMVGSQALLNVLGGERYKMVTNEIKNYFKGEYGQPPAPIDEEIRVKVIGEEKVITCRPADLLPPQLPEARKEIAALAETMEDVLSYCLFPQVTKKFLEDRMAGKTNVEYAMLGGEPGKVNYCPV
ncbi:MAG: pyruvate carboxylase subunit B [Clostridiales bacterium]|jgi:oxaloacetate decarboxylase alpha subunit|nr:pyruvate carboxylase subunit B [Clostridiales bacterium]